MRVSGEIENKQVQTVFDLKKEGGVADPIGKKREKGGRRSNRFLGREGLQLK